MVNIRTFALVVASNVALFATGAQYPYAWMDPKIIAAMLISSFSHFMLYPWIWYSPESYQKYLAGGHGVEVYMYLVAVQKTLYTVGGLYCFFNLNTFISMFFDYPIFSAIAVAMSLFGVFLQREVYKKIGKEGVYYGFKLGKHIPWCFDYPFTVYRHPQYTGCVLIYLGMQFLIMYKDFPGEWATMSMFHIWAYGMTGIMEEGSDQVVDTSAAETPKKEQSKTNEMTPKTALKVE